MPPTSKKLKGYVGYGLSMRASVHSSRSMHASVLKFHIWIPMEKYLFFFLSELSPFLELCPFENIRMKSDACLILWTVHARVLKFHIWISHGKIADPYFCFCPCYLPFWSYAPLKKIRTKFCQQNISKTVRGRGLKLVQLIGDDV